MAALYSPSRASSLAYQPWRKSSASAANGDCVEVALEPGMIVIRDSTNHGAPSRSASMLAFAYLTSDLTEM